MAFTNRGPADPALGTTTWAAIKTYWRRARQPCARCGRPIDYDRPYWLTIAGRRTINPWALHVGHIVSRRRGRALGWTEDQVNALANTRPEHARCSVRSGAREGNAAQRAARPPPRVVRYI